MLDKSLKFLKAAEKLAEGTLPTELLEEGVKVVDYFYSTAQGQSKPYTVSLDPIDKGVALVAKGEDVVFREFGAGTAAHNHFPNAKDLPPIYPGSWSETEGYGEFATYGSWHHKGHKYTSIAPTLGMFHALDVIRHNIHNYAERVMK